MKSTLLALALLIAGFSQANGSFDCEILITATSPGVVGGIFDDDIKVPDGKTCAIEGGVMIDGNIDVEEGATLTITSTPGACPTILGNIDADKSKTLSIVRQDEADCPNGIVVDGGIEAKKLEFGSIDIVGVNVDGDIKIEECNLNGDLTVFGNTIPSDKQIVIKENAATSITVGKNSVAKRISFEENDFNDSLVCTLMSPTPAPVLADFAGLVEVQVPSGPFVVFETLPTTLVGASAGFVSLDGEPNCIPSVGCTASLDPNDCYTLTQAISVSFGDVNALITSLDVTFDGVTVPTPAPVISGSTITYMVSFGNTCPARRNVRRG